MQPPTAGQQFLASKHTPIISIPVPNIAQSYQVHHLSPPLLILHNCSWWCFWSCCSCIGKFGEREHGYDTGVAYDVFDRVMFMVLRSELRTTSCSEATVHFLSKQTGKGSRHGVKQSFPRHPHNSILDNAHFRKTWERIRIRDFWWMALGLIRGWVQDSSSKFWCHERETINGVHPKPIKQNECGTVSDFLLVLQAKKQREN